MKKVLIIIFLFVLAQDVFSQSFYSRRINRNWVATGGVGYARALGDLTNPGSYFDSKLNFEGGIQYRASDRVNIRTNLLFFQLSGSDDDIDPEQNTRSRGLSFVSNNVELSVGTSISLFPHMARYRQRKMINPYAFAGIGVLFFDPRAEIPDSINVPGTGSVALENAGKMVSLAKYNTERPNDYSQFAFVIPVGVGVKVKVADFLDVSAEVSNRITFTDYLDDVSGRNYADPELFDFTKQEDREAYGLSNPTGTTSNIRGNPDSNDYYMIVTLKAEFYLQGDLFDKLFGIGGKRFKTQSRRRSGLFNFNNGPRRRMP
ncbi:outer membrane beta-barrel protein [Marivirga sp. S37H4]|uniref:Outer membrane beta-barrel protein n=1 Tax=Marivirga aurantiaca TaxID=2802615 RepID=A0A935C6L2_9BACT|nr:DUF6089 family protein [Marivirga aurantiaca]MBK6264506.1 outer membrane beta-barrel protein [Marivirga aurantiaca]